MTEPTIALEFVRGVVSAVFRTAVSSTERLLDSPPGRSPDRRLVDLSAWYNGLEPGDRELVRKVVSLAVDQAVFGMLAGLDGSRTILPLDKADGLVLEAQTDAGRVAVTGTTPLHDEYRGLVSPMGILGEDAS